MMKAYTILGTTDDVTTCELCGRDELKGTVALCPLDVDGNEDGDAVYFGTSCAAKAAGWTVREVKAGVKAADEAKRAAERAARDAEHAAQMTFMRAWYVENYGTADAWEAAKIAGTTAPRLSDRALQAYRESLQEPAASEPANVEPVAAEIPVQRTVSPVVDTRRVCDRPRCTRPAPATDLYCSQGCYEMDNDDIPATVSFRPHKSFAGLHWQTHNTPIRFPLGRR
ncbi:hypothetical protein [Streptomyces hydrogenans]|uniref:hypothetical protein n=1 Tax=Streptomyces hydrogenans TaxID=1873719 RepID=UPI0035E28263